MESTKKVIFSLQMPIEVRAVIDEVAKDQGLTASELARRALALYLLKALDRRPYARIRPPRIEIQRMAKRMGFPRETIKLAVITIDSACRARPYDHFTPYDVAVRYWRSLTPDVVKLLAYLNAIGVEIGCQDWLAGPKGLQRLL